ncbi:uncharacterized protein F4822DRAFT_433714 [Hypoxylon trugodes]|uniref:uncharacterized protein n=1 Tax=Hypoxylon trugodes TaxID=326681 RepID=UPI002196968B|nr:uncharacterized protein F4822DRAFT_433714 [Hypoxylon trugodes]KAI1383774.1 hypothetical protein F4822DRAFT_433714 [Hypoxylon trugodes]
MKGTKLLTALLFLHFTSSTPLQTEPSPSETYAPCIRSAYNHFLVRNWRSITHNDSSETFHFTLSANFTSYSSSCSGIRYGEDNSGWLACDDSDATFDFSSNDYININLSYICDRGPEETDPRNKYAIAKATGDSRLTIGLVDTPEGHFTGTEGDNITIPAYSEIAHRLPSLDCAVVSRRTEWEVRNFEYRANVHATSPWIIPGTTVTINYDLYNPANDYLINCQAVNTTLADTPDNPELISPDARWPCPIDYRDDLMPPEAYPTTGFWFNKSSNEITIKQEWDCTDEDDEDEEITFSETGSTILPLQCHDIFLAPDSTILKAVECDALNATVKASLVS